jgi:two-component system, OmpR family, phosphate regulon response regulator PhoB
MSAKVLVVEDERDVRDLITLHVKREGYEVDAVETGGQALQSIQKKTYDLVVLDWMLPEVSGLEICKKLMGVSPVLMVTAKAEPADIVLGLEMGADDYVTKPFEIPVLVARVRALLRRKTQKVATEPARLQIGDLVLNTETYDVQCKGKKIELTASEFKLLSALMKNAGKVLSRDKLIDLVQGEGIVVTDRAIDTHVFGLRKKLDQCSEVVETIRGVGYRVKPQT